MRLTRGFERVLVVWLAWAVVSLGFGIQIYLIESVSLPGRIEWWRPFAIELLCYQFWFLLTPLVLRFGAKFPLETSDWQGNLVAHLAASAVVPTLYLLLCQTFVLHWLRPLAFRPPTLGAEYLYAVVAGYPTELLTYWVIVGIQHGVRIFHERRAREVASAQMQARLAEARLLALTMQLQPHFLFNTLNTISALIHEDPDAADRMLARLGDLLRITLEGGSRSEVTLRQELELLQRYLAIEEVRFADRLQISMDVAPETLDARVPSLLLQPLVENALRHGLARRQEPGRLGIRATLENDFLRLVIDNDGPPLREPRAEGIGLSNTRARLLQLYGPEHRFDIRDLPAGGVSTELVLPLRRAS
jgi:hypothetical protein